MKSAPLPSFPQKNPEKKLKTSPQESCFKSLVPKQATHWTNINFSKQNQIPCLPILQYQFVSLFFFKQNCCKTVEKTEHIFFFNTIKRKQANKLFCMKLVQEKKKDEWRTKKHCHNFWVFNFFSFSAKPRRGKSSKPSSCWGCSGDSLYQQIWYCCYHFHYYHYHNDGCFGDPENKSSGQKNNPYAFQTAQDNQPYPKAEGCFWLCSHITQECVQHSARLPPFSGLQELNLQSIYDF